MHRKFGLRVLVVGVALSMAGCAAPPTAEIDSAKVSLDQAKTAGAAEYATGSLTAAQDAQAALDAELATQNQKWLKTYTKATELANAAKAAAEKAAADAAAGKAKAKADATAAIERAKTALADAQALLEKAPKGKGSAADLEAMKTDLANAAASITDAEAALNSERLVDAKAKAESATTAATNVKTAVETAMAAKKR